MTLRLTPDDYNYISFQAADKALKRLYRSAGLGIALLTLIGAVSIVVFINNYAKSQADIYLKKLVNSEEFKQTYMDALSMQVQQINNNYELINQRLNESELFKNLPYDIDNNAFEVTDSNGRRFVIETGVASINHVAFTNQTIVKFNRVYSQPPIVLTSNIFDFSPRYSHIKPGRLTVYGVTQDSFEILSEGGRGAVNFVWVAIGY